MPRKKKDKEDTTDEEAFAELGNNNEDFEEATPSGNDEAEFVSSDEHILAKIDNLTEKSRAVRTGALEGLIRSLQNYNSVHVVLERAEGMVAALASILKKNSAASEFTMACKLLSLVAVALHSLEYDTHSLWEGMQPLLQTTITNDSKELETRVAAAESLGVLSWIGLVSYSLEEAELNDVVELFDSVLNKLESPPDLVVACCDATSLLLTRAPEQQLAGSSYVKYLRVCVSLLGHPTFEVRSSAGELLALLHEASLVCESPDTEDIEALDEVDMDRVMDVLQALATDGSRKQSRKDRAKQKSFFRDILRTVEDGEVPTEKMVLSRETHEFEGWRMILQLSRMRDLLHSGLPYHLIHNELLTEVFGVYVPEPAVEEVSAQAKKAGKQQRQREARENYEEKAKGRKKKEQMATFDDDY